ncbi:F-box protein (macronuclear) [Tetrahymena thermophila SB210]|uniref:F-box protein n=1 Tax=Tetrahymena thermophila (strain SB210) TaxID=312017 RepID=I7MIL9_TETTS|nr:F-box protein [Tetrahymena thermophila SB210]EAR93830.1 F-box protein [Tetrahymena thermophila SB210]|eukprot:XP_001014075.1 F-box protein [Tetrahymena thermophila SB210]
MEKRQIEQVLAKEESLGIKKKFKQIQEQTLDIPKHELWLIYEFCEFNALKTQLVIEHTKKVRIKKLLKDMVSFPKSAWQHIESILSNFKNELEQLEKAEKEEEAKREEELKKKIQEQIEQKTIEPGIITKVPDHFILDIADYLDCYSLFKFSFACKKFRQLITTKNKQIFKKFCVALYKEVPSLPLQTAFNSIQDIMNEHPYNYSPELRLRVNQDVRKVAWNCYNSDKPVHLLYKTSAKFYQKFNNYYTMFMEAPRIHFGGYYICKERYTKIGEKDLHHTITPLIEITYYRYFRFLPDGRMFFLLSNKKLKKDAIIKSLSQDYYLAEQYEMNQLNNNGNMLANLQDKQQNYGEFVLKEDYVYVRFNSSTTVFQYDMKIASSSYGAHNLLIVANYSMLEIPLNHNYSLYKAKPEDSSKVFRYKPLEELRIDLTDPQFQIYKKMSL